MKGNTGEVDLEERGVGERLGGVEGEEAAVWVHYIREEKKYFFKKISYSYAAIFYVTSRC